VTRIAEQYYIEAFRMEGEGNAGGAKGNLQKAVGLWQMAIDKLPTDANTMPQACCWAGDCYRTLGEYEKSRECFQRVVDGHPEYCYAWYALYMVGRNYQDMGSSGLISKSEADMKAKAAYQQLLEKYPACAAAKYVEQWLSDNNSK
jgi:tetratricopeptide (TPR) repeat protein